MDDLLPSMSKSFPGAGGGPQPAITWRNIKAPWALLSIIDIAATLVGSFDIPLLSGVLQALLLPFELIVYVSVGVRTVHDGSEWRGAALRCAALGAVFGLTMAVVKVALIGENWTLYNLVTEPGMTALAGMVAGGASGALWERRRTLGTMTEQESRSK